MTNIFDVLHQEHERVAQMLEQIEKMPEKDTDTMTGLVEEVRKDLEAHASFEEAEVYPAIEQAVGHEGELHDAIEEHDEAIRLLELLSVSLEEGDERWKERIGDLKTAIQHHVKEEEQEIFPEARRKLPESRAEQLASEYDVFKQKIAAE